MELLTTKTLWYGFDPSAEQLDVTVARVEKEEKLTFKKIYFTGRTFASGRQTRICAHICQPNKRATKSVLLISPSGRENIHQEIRDIAERGFVAMAVDIDGRTENSCGTMYPEEVSYCNAIENKDVFFFGESVRESKLYEQALSCMRAITYLVEEMKVSTVSVVTLGHCSSVGIIVCAQDKRVTNGAFLFGELNIDYPEKDFIVDGKASLQDQFAHDDKSQAWTMGLAPQSYIINISVPVFVVNSANSHISDVTEVSKYLYRLNDQSRLLIVPDTLDCLDSRYIKSVIAWCKGTNAPKDYDLSYYVEEGNYFVKLRTSAYPQDVAVWYCTNANALAKHWVKAQLEQIDDGYVGKLDLYQENCNVIAFAEIKDKITTSSPLLEIPVKNARNVKMANSIVFTGEGNYKLINITERKAWTFTNSEYKRQKGYLDIVGAKGSCLATFALTDASVKKNFAFAVTFDICASEKGTLHVAVVCDYGKTNDVYVAQVELHAVGKWQRVTVEGSQFLSNSSERSKSMPADKVPEVLVLKSDQTFLVNNIILV